MKNLLTVKASEGLCNCRIKMYPDTNGVYSPVQVMVSENKIFNPYRLEKHGYENTTTEFGTDDSCGVLCADDREERTDNSRAVYRARAKVLDCIRCNLDLTYFCTLTFNEQYVNREDYKEVVRKFSQWCDNRVRRKGLKYVGVIERHRQSNGLHFHVLCNDVLSVIDSGTVKCAGYKKPIRISTADRYKIPEENRKTVYNISDWSYGFSTAIRITGDNSLIKVSAYLQKYLTKDTEKVGGRFYYSGGKLLRPKYEYCTADFYDDTNDYIIKVPANTLKVWNVGILKNDA